MRFRLIPPLALAALVCAGAAPAAAPDDPSKPTKLKAVPKLDFADIGAPTIIPRSRQDRRSVARLTEPATAGLVAPPRYVIGREGTAATGKRAKLSVKIGDTNLFAVGGKIPARPRAGAVLDPTSDRRSGAPQKLESGRVYGAGVERRVGPLELGAQYIFSTINGAELDPTADARSYGIAIDDESESHSLRATVKLRF